MLSIPENINTPESSIPAFQRMLGVWSAVLLKVCEDFTLSFQKIFNQRIRRWITTIERNGRNIGVTSIDRRRRLPPTGGVP
mmetsp:Transcript_2151/g.5998  ORF Transcript_2151/g.5998 Transcript_2151/m.5998 type:complete len:81 (-) Transcript_2151:134-376(-)